MTRLLLSLRALLYGSGFVFIWGWLALSVRPLDRRLAWSVPAWLVPVGIVLVVAGGALALWCVALFVSTGRGTPAPFDAPRDFVAGGPYRWVRNPMYVGGFGVLLGTGLWIGSLAIALLAPVTMLLAHLFVVLYEEPALRSRFGTDYERYLAAVPRWIPSRPGRQ